MCMLAGPCACINVTNSLGSGITHRLGKKTLDPQVGNYCLTLWTLDMGTKPDAEGTDVQEERLKAASHVATPDEWK